MKPQKKITRAGKRVFWLKHIKSYSSSSISQAAYCRENKLSYWSFNSWKKKLEKEKNSAGFIEISSRVQGVTEITDLRYGEANLFKIILKNGLRIEIPDNFDIRQLQRIIKYAGDIS